MDVVVAAFCSSDRLWVDIFGLYGRRNKSEVERERLWSSFQWRRYTCFQECKRGCKRMDHIDGFGYLCQRFTGHWQATRAKIMRLWKPIAAAWKELHEDANSIFSLLCGRKWRCTSLARISLLCCLGTFTEESECYLKIRAPWIMHATHH